MFSGTGNRPVVIATPSGMHFEHATQSYGDRVQQTRRGGETNFMRPAQLTAAVETAERCGVNLYPVFQNRYNKAVSRVRHALASGELGELRTVSVRLRWCRLQRYYDLAPGAGPSLSMAAH